MFKSLNFQYPRISPINNQNSPNSEVLNHDDRKIIAYQKKPLSLCQLFLLELASTYRMASQPKRLLSLHAYFNTVHLIALKQKSVQISSPTGTALNTNFYCNVFKRLKENLSHSGKTNTDCDLTIMYFTLHPLKQNNIWPNTS